MREIVELRNNDTVAILSIPDIVVTKPIDIRLKLVGIPIHIRDEGPVVLYKISSKPPPLEYSQGCILFETS